MRRFVWFALVSQWLKRCLQVKSGVSNRGFGLQVSGRLTVGRLPAAGPHPPSLCRTMSSVPVWETAHLSLPPQTHLVRALVCARDWY